MEQYLGKHSWMITGYVYNIVQHYRRREDFGGGFASNSTYFIECDLEWDNQVTKLELTFRSPITLEEGELISVFGIRSDADGYYSYINKSLNMCSEVYNLSWVYGIFITIISIPIAFSLWNARAGLPFYLNKIVAIFFFLVPIGLALRIIGTINLTIKKHKTRKWARKIISSFETSLNKLEDSNQAIENDKELEKYLMENLKLVEV